MRPLTSSIHALCIGINQYPGTGYDLRGCVNDAEDWATRLDKRGADVITLLDEAATGAAIRAAIVERLAAAGPGDLVVITWSGFGTWVPDIDGEHGDIAGVEPDQRHEALCPYDVRTAGPLLDDELFLLLTGRDEGVRVVLVLDACHCGGLFRHMLPGAGSVSRVRFLPPEVFLAAAQLPAAARIPGRYRGRPRDAAVLLTGCRDIEFSFDGTFEGRPNGAFTYAALAVLHMLPEEATYRDWMLRIGQILPSQDHPQTPGLQGPPQQLRRAVLT
jgi:hypothetical protein